MKFFQYDEESNVDSRWKYVYSILKTGSDIVTEQNPSLKKIEIDSYENIVQYHKANLIYSQGE